MAVYTDDLLSSGHTDWCIHGVGLTPSDEAIANVLGEQDYLYTVVTRSTSEEDVRVIGAITNYLYFPNGTAELCAHVLEQDYRIISMTVTENGYRYTGNDRHLDFTDAAVAHDVENPENPRSLVGFLFRVAQLLIENSRPLPTFLSCDNLPHNGRILRKLVLQFAEEVDANVAAGIRERGSFPNSMVDRITPTTTASDREYVRRNWGIDDGWPVVCEDFRQWFIEDDFSNGRPDWDQVGAVFVSDVTPYEQMKIKLLNGSHSALSYISYLVGYRRVDRAMSDSSIYRFVKQYMKEIEPTVGTVPGLKLDEYEETLLARFANPAIGDQVLRLCQDGSQKIPNMILESVTELRSRGASTSHAAFALAAWIRFLHGVDESGTEIPIDDPQAETLTDAANRCTESIDPFLALDFVFPKDLQEDGTFKNEVWKWYRAILSEGAEQGLRKLLET
jgi:mannitol 2-dehydrogenase